MRQPVTLRLADDLEKHVGGNIAFRSAAELRRLHELNAELVEALEIILDSKPFVGMNPRATVGSPDAIGWNVHRIAREALAKARGTE